MPWRRGRRRCWRSRAERRLVAPSVSERLPWAFPLDDGADVDDERGRPIAQQRRAAEEWQRAAYGVELLYNDFVLPDELVDRHRRPPVADVDHQHLLEIDVRQRRVTRQSDERPQAQERQHPPAR